VGTTITNTFADLMSTRGVGVIQATLALKAIFRVYSMRAKLLGTRCILAKGQMGDPGIFSNSFTNALRQRCPILSFRSSRVLLVSAHMSDLVRYCRLLRCVWA